MRRCGTGDARNVSCLRAPCSATICAAVRLILVLMLVHGLVPGLAKAGEAVMHYARTGHVHTTEDQGDLGDKSPEHGCGTTAHQCTCCASQLVVPSAAAVVDTVQGCAPRPVAPVEMTIPAREPPRPFRPPIS